MKQQKTYYGIPNNKEKKSSYNEHMDHKLIVSVSTGPHYGKLSCMTCGNKFIKWLNKEQYYMYK